MYYIWIISGTQFSFAYSTMSETIFTNWRSVPAVARKNTIELMTEASISTKMQSTSASGLVGQHYKLGYPARIDPRVYIGKGI